MRPCFNSAALYLSNNSYHTVIKLSEKSKKIEKTYGVDCITSSLMRYIDIFRIVDACIIVACLRVLNDQVLRKIKSEDASGNNVCRSWIVKQNGIHADGNSNQKTIVFSLLCSGNWTASHDKYEWNTHLVNNNWRSKIHRRGYAYQAILFSSAFLVKPQGSNSGNSMSLPTSSLDAPSSLMERL